MGSIPGQRTKIFQATRLNQKKKKVKKKLTLPHLKSYLRNHVFDMLVLFLLKGYYRKNVHQYTA